MASSSEDEDELYQELSEELYGVLSESDAAAVLAAVRGTRAARSKVDGAGTGQPLRAHRFLLTGGAMNNAGIEALEVVTRTGELVPATSLCQFVRQAAAEQLEVYREIQRRGLRMPRELPIDAPYRAHVRGFTGIDKGLRKWLGYAELCALGHDGGEPAYEYVPGEPTGRILSFLVDAAAIAVLAKRQAPVGATALALGQALADDVVGHVLPFLFVGVLPRNDEETVAFLKDQCSTDCGGTGSNGTYLEVAESVTPEGEEYVEAVIFSTREGLFSVLDAGADQPEDEFYTFAAAGSSEPVVSLPTKYWQY